MLYRLVLNMFNIHKKKNTIFGVCLTYSHSSFHSDSAYNNERILPGVT